MNFPKTFAIFRTSDHLNFTLADDPDSAPTRPHEDAFLCLDDSIRSGTCWRVVVQDSAHFIRIINNYSEVIIHRDGYLDETLPTIEIYD